MRTYEVSIPGQGRTEVQADAMELSPSGALVFYVNTGLGLSRTVYMAYADGAWRTVTLMDQVVPASAPVSVP